jgi:hypothetical protein
MSRYLTPFSSIDHLAPLFEQGGELVFVPLIVHSANLVMYGNVLMTDVQGQIWFKAGSLSLPVLRHLVL